MRQRPPSSWRLELVGPVVTSREEVEVTCPEWRLFGRCGSSAVLIDCIDHDPFAGSEIFAGCMAFIGTYRQVEAEIHVHERIALLS